LGIKSRVILRKRGVLPCCLRLIILAGYAIHIRAMARINHSDRGRLLQPHNWRQPRLETGVGFSNRQNSAKLVQQALINEQT
jgi:hypothetical protein